MSNTQATDYAALFKDGVELILRKDNIVPLLRSSIRPAACIRSFVEDQP